MEQSGSELLLYGGIVIMILTALCAVVLAVFFSHRGKKLRQRLEQEYGKPQHENQR